MRRNMESNSPSFIDTWNKNTDYFDMLTLLASLSKLFSDNTIPYLDYRIAENLFCKYYNAINDARSCTAYDAHFNNLGIGIKTFGIPNGSSTEKIAEFNKLRPLLDGLKGINLAQKLATFRNDRIELANNIYNIQNSLYHIVGRTNNALQIFNTSYKKIDINDIHDIKDTIKSISFVSDNEFYTFNKSKSVLLKRFELPKDYKEIPVDIIDDPLQVLSILLNKNTNKQLQHNSYSHDTKGIDYVILPLYSTRGIIHVPEKSGLNQWNAGGRPRHEDEVYIPVPKAIYKKYPSFFPNNRNTIFELRLPDGTPLTAKMCQSDLKGLMSNPNAALGNWILRKVLKKKPRELVTMDDLLRFGIDSVRIIKKHQKNSQGQEIYEISFTSTAYESYSDFIDEN